MQFADVAAAELCHIGHFDLGYLAIATRIKICQHLLIIPAVHADFGQWQVRFQRQIAIFCFDFNYV